jgi:hypothetical protein
VGEAWAARARERRHVDTSSVLLTGPAGDASQKAGEQTRRRLGVPLDGHVIGGNGPLIGRTGEWTDIYGIGPDRVVLVRPYGHVAWRANSAQPEAGKVLKGAFRQLLHHN